MLTGGVQMLLANALLPLTGLITAGFLTRMLGASDYGLFTLTATMIVWIKFIAQSLFSRGTIKLIGDAEDWRPTATMILRTRLAFSLVLMATVWALSVPVAKLLDAPRLAGCLALLALELPLFALATGHRQILIGLGSYRQGAWMTAGQWIARFLLIIALVGGVAISPPPDWIARLRDSVPWALLRGDGLAVRAAILALIGASIAQLLIGRHFIRPSLRGRHHLSRRPLWDIALPMLFVALSLRLVRLDLFMVKALGGSLADAGHYGAAQNLALVPNLIGMAVSPLLLSTLTRLQRDRERGQARHLARSAMRLGCLVLPFGGMMAGAASGIVRFVFGPGFESAAPILSVLVFAAVALMLISIATSILTAADKPGWALSAAAPLVPLAIAGHMIAIPRLGMVGAAGVTAVCAVLGVLTSWVAVYRLWQITPPLPSVVRSVSLTVGATILAGIGPMTGVLLIVKLVGLTVMVAAGYLLLGEFERSELSLIYSLLPRRKPRASAD